MSSFTAASRRLGLSKQFVSRRVMALEETLGARLLIRNTRRLAVTELGLDFYERGKRILGEVEDAEQAMLLQQAGPRGLLRIAAPMSFGMRHLSPLVAMFLSEHKQVRFDMEMSDRTVDLIGEGFDMAVRIGALADSSLVAQKLADVKVLACCSPRYHYLHGTPSTPRELTQHACLIYGHGGVASWEFGVDGKRLHVDIEGPLRANNGDLLRDAAIAGLGIALLPEFIVADALQSGALVPVLRAFTARPFTLYAVYPQHRQRSATIRAFTAFLKERLANGLVSAPCNGDANREPGPEPGTVRPHVAAAPVPPR